MIEVFAPNLKSRPDRKKNLEMEFANREEFSLNIIIPEFHPIGVISLWKTIQNIVKRNKDSDTSFFVLCEDDHQFTEHYNHQLLHNAIIKAIALDADILSGGVSWFKTGVQISKNVFWVEKFTATQFIIVFKKFYDLMLHADFSEGDDADFKISTISDKNFVIHPFLSVQKEFGYSDVTFNNNESGRVERLFENTSERFELLKRVRSFYLSDFKK